MKLVRAILLIIVSLVLIYLTFNFKNQTFFFDSIIWCFFLVLGIILFLWNFFLEMNSFFANKKIKNLALTISAIIVAILIVVLDNKIQSNFEKPSLLKVFYDGDFNGVGIDFKKDGTYIFDNSTIGLSDYSYVKYKINGNLITLDKSHFENIIHSKNLKIVEQINFSDSSKENYLYKIDKNGEILKNEFSFRIVHDFRNYTKKEEKNKNKTAKP